MNHQKTSHYWNTVAEAWQEKHPQKLWRIHADMVNIALFNRWLPDEQVELLLKTDSFDEACSTGLYPLLASHAKTVVGMDVSMLTLHAARSRSDGLQVAAADARHLPFANETFDVIISDSTLDHFESLDGIVVSLHEFHRVLRAGEPLLITLDNLANPIIALRNALPFRLLNRLGIVPYYVGSTLGPRRLCHILEQVGFEVIEVSAIMHCPRVLAVAMANILEKFATDKIQKKFLHLLLAFEHLSKWPTRFLTGYFVAAKALKRGDHQHNRAHSG
jgi:SAM-dependent methyltransferase